MSRISRVLLRVLPQRLPTYSRPTVRVYTTWGLRLPFAKKVPETERFLPTPKVIGKKRDQRRRRYLLTLDTTQLSRHNQKLIDLSGMLLPRIRCGPKSLPIRVFYENAFNKPPTPFPPKTRGLFYFDKALDDLPVSASVKFRLCNSPTREAFEAGKDLLLTDGVRPWMLRFLSIWETHKPLRDLIVSGGFMKEEDVKTIPEFRVSYERIIRTLDPAKIPSSTQVPLDISGMMELRVVIEGDPRTFNLYNHRQRFPESCKGILYFHRDPDRDLLETGISIRLRLCDSAAGFEAGRDLLTGAGVPWCKTIYGRMKHMDDVVHPLERLIVKEGLVSEEEIRALQLRKINVKPPFRNLDTEFDLTFDTLYHPLWLVGREKTAHVTMTPIPAPVCYRGRAIVRLEQTAPLSDPDCALVMRILRFTQPPIYIGEGSEQTAMLVRPQVGELLQRRAHGKIKPWKFPVHSKWEHAEEWRNFLANMEGKK